MFRLYCTICVLTILLQSFSKIHSTILLKSILFSNKFSKLKTLIEQKFINAQSFNFNFHLKIPTLLYYLYFRNFYDFFDIHSAIMLKKYSLSFTQGKSKELNEKRDTYEMKEIHVFCVSISESLNSSSCAYCPPQTSRMFFSILLYGCQSSGTSIRCTHSGKKQCTTSPRRDTLDLTGSSSYPHASKEFEESYGHL